MTLASDIFSNRNQIVCSSNCTTLPLSPIPVTRTEEWLNPLSAAIIFGSIQREHRLLSERGGVLAAYHLRSHDELSLGLSSPLSQAALLPDTTSSPPEYSVFPLYNTCTPSPAFLAAIPTRARNEWGCMTFSWKVERSLLHLSLQSISSDEDPHSPASTHISTLVRADCKWRSSLSEYRLNLPQSVLSYTTGITTWKSSKRAKSGKKNFRGVFGDIKKRKW